MSTAVDSVLYCLAATTAFIVSIICWRLLYKEYQARKIVKITTNLDLNVENKYQTYLDLWSLLAMICIALSTTIGPFQGFKALCIFVNIFTFRLYTFNRIFITYYQISRLQYCFANKQVHSKYGYSDSLFIFLYIIGIVLAGSTLYVGIDVWFFTDWFHVKWGVFYNCFVESEDTETFIAWSFLILYYVWDWTVFACYFIKICQFYKKKGIDNVEEPVTTRIKFILYKIAFLTAILEITGLITMILLTLAYRYWEYNYAMLTFIGIYYAFDHFVSFYMMYLMIDQNNEYYIDFVHKLSKIGLFCCCKTFIDITSSMEIEKVVNIEKKKGTKRISQWTKTGSTSDKMPQPMTKPRESMGTHLEV